MANILYGVHGTGHGHAIRALTIAAHFPQHNFLFISDSDGYNLLHSQYQVFRLPAHGCPAFQHVMPHSKVLAIYFKTILTNYPYKKKALALAESFQPDVAITDYEPCVPWVARRLNIPCLSLDHQHVARYGNHNLSFSRTIDQMMLRFAMMMQFYEVKNHMIISFFDIPVQTNSRARIFPPILRKEVLQRSPSQGNHVLAYHGYSTTKEFHRFLSSLNCPVRCYGTNENRTVGNITFKENNTDQFLDDLASCRYVVSTAGHTLLSESLYYGKPVMAFPIRNAFEQYLNGHYLVRKGYGVVNDAFQPSHERLAVFEKNLDLYREKISRDSFYGNEEVVFALTQYFADGQYIVSTQQEPLKTM